MPLPLQSPTQIRVPGLDAAPQSSGRRAAIARAETAAGTAAAHAAMTCEGWVAAGVAAVAEAAPVDAGGHGFACAAAAVAACASAHARYCRIQAVRWSKSLVDHWLFETASCAAGPPVAPGTVPVERAGLVACWLRRGARARIVATAAAAAPRGPAAAGTAMEVSRLGRWKGRFGECPA
ncbi:hypothetical protein Vretimale_5592 [Volvox reticuliferus]|uniref:Uncharacterized protein n=1 Tax=Volvox reticuliferus TaxID=1737510 RepID=A0A8J4G5S6_9CHLO|nr:hypothetical protein Vretifemale_5616 [Volvox reticuliferus]GIM00619.1 hypothetical protein Vretimale_5592 [Volvox reticuliferus]